MDKIVEALQAFVNMILQIIQSIKNLVKGARSENDKH
jgi:ferritin